MLHFDNPYHKSLELIKLGFVSMEFLSSWALFKLLYCSFTFSIKCSIFLFVAEEKVVSIKAMAYILSQLLDTIFLSLVEERYIVGDNVELAERCIISF